MARCEIGPLHCAPMQKASFVRRFFVGGARRFNRLLERLPLAAGLIACLAAAGASAAPPPAPAALVAPCGDWIRRLPNLKASVCEAARLEQNNGRSFRGVPLYQRDVLPVKIAEAERHRVLVIGGIHGDELSSVSLVMHWIGHAEQTPADLEWRFVPLVNPDGALQRKPTRMNARGV